MTLTGENLGRGRLDETAAHGQHGGSDEAFRPGSDEAETATLP
jgi:hypothetical protein